MSENISSLKMMGPAETEEIDSLISVSACNTAAVKSKVTFSFLFNDELMTSRSQLKPRLLKEVCAF